MKRITVLGTTVSALLFAACESTAPTSPPGEPALAEPSAASAQTSLLAATPEAGAEVKVLELSPDLRAGMTETLTAALTEFEIQPDAAMAALQEFFQEIEAQ